MSFGAGTFERTQLHLFARKELILVVKNFGHSSCVKETIAAQGKWFTLHFGVSHTSFCLAQLLDNDTSLRKMNANLFSKEISLKEDGVRMSTATAVAKS